MQWVVDSEWLVGRYFIFSMHVDEDACAMDVPFTLQQLVEVHGFGDRDLEKSVGPVHVLLDGERKSTMQQPSRDPKVMSGPGRPLKAPDAFRQGPDKIWPEASHEREM